MEMSKRERLLAALNGRETDRMPWAPLVDGYFISSLEKQGLHMDLLQAMRYIGNDILERHAPGPRLETSHVEYRRQVAGDILRDYIETPVGTIYKESRQSAGTLFQTRHMVETLADLQVLQYVIEHSHVVADTKAYIARDREIGDDGIPTLSGPVCPLQEMLQSFAGVENTVYLLADSPEETEAFFAAVQERNRAIYRAMAEFPCPVVFDYEDTSTTVISRSMYEHYTAPAIDEYADILHSAGKLFITHMCGKLSGFAQEIGRGKMDGIDSVCPPTTGDLCCWDARRIWGPQKAIIGGIEPPALARMTVAETLAYVSEIMERLVDKTGFILSTGDAVPYGTPMDNMRAVTELIARMGPASLTGCAAPELIAELAEKYKV